MIDVDEDGILNLMEAQHVLKCLGFKGFDAESVNIIFWRHSYLTSGPFLDQKISGRGQCG